MRYPTEGTMEGSFWTIQGKAKPDESWASLPYENMPAEVYERAYEAFERYGTRGFLTLYAARKALRKLRAVAKPGTKRWAYWVRCKFRLVLVKFCIEVEEAR